MERHIARLLLIVGLAGHNAAGGEDNTTVIVVQIKKLSGPGLWQQLMKRVTS